MSAVILVNPRIPDVKPYEAVCPLNLLCLAATLRTSLGIAPHIIDLVLGDDEFAALTGLLSAAPAIVGISTMTVTVPETLRLARFIKEISPASVVIVGGVHATIAPQDLIGEPAVDYVLKGEADRSFPRLVEAILHGQPPQDIPGLVTRDCVPSSIAAPIEKDLDSLPFPAFDLVDLSRYEQSLTVVSSRGCPYDCVYCSAAEISGRNWRAYSTNRLVDDLARLVNEFQVTRISFSDDIFTLNAKRVREICAAIQARGLAFEWSCLARPDHATVELLRTMREAGCTRVYFGAESAVDGNLAYAGRRYASDVITQAVANARAAGIRDVITSFIVGFPRDTAEHVRATLNFADGLDSFIQIHALTPFPGTPLARNLSQVGMRVEESDYGLYNCQRAVTSTASIDLATLRILLAEGLLLCYEHNRNLSVALGGQEAAAC